MKKLFILLLAFILCLSSVACGKKYVDDVSASSLASSLEQGIVTDGGYRQVDSDFITFNFETADKYIKDCSIVVAKDSGANANEIGVFRANSKDSAKKLAQICDNYVDNKVAHWNYDYNPDENVKIENASVHVFGVYVIYMFLTPEDTNYALIIIDNLIAEGA